MTMATTCEQNYIGMSCEHEHHGNGKNKTWEPFGRIWNILFFLEDFEFSSK